MSICHKNSNFIRSSFVLPHTCGICSWPGACLSDHKLEEQYITGGDRIQKLTQLTVADYGDRAEATGWLAKPDGLSSHRAPPNVSKGAASPARTQLAHMEMPPWPWLG